MSWIVRTLLIWLLVLAVPAQGMAAATLAFCGPGHHGGASQRAEAGGTSAHAQHGTAASLHEADAGAALEAATAVDTQTVDQPSPLTPHKCSACASCCSLGALLSAVAVIPASDPAPTVFITVVPSVDAFAAGGPDRPPRKVLA